MNISAIKQVATRTLGRSGLVIQKHSPVILTAVGIVGTVTSAVMASKATLKLEKEVDWVRKDVEFLKQHKAESETYTDKQYTQDLTLAYTKGTIAIVKLYGPAVTLGVASIGCLIGAQGIMHKRNVALVAAYKGIEQTFAEYRKRVVDEVGEDKDREYRYGKLVESTEDILNEKGEKTSEVTVKKFDPNGVSMYARFFDEFNQNWSKRPEENLLFLRAQQTYINQLLQVRGHVLLNDVYDALGMDRTSAGTIVGWVISKEGDNYIDFGIYDFESEKAREFVNGQERSILLDFNVDGVIWDKI